MKIEKVDVLAMLLTMPLQERMIMTKEERAMKWMGESSEANKLSMEEKVKICDRVAKEIALICLVILVIELVVLYLVSDGAAFEWLAEQLNRFSTNSHGVRRYKSLASFSIILYFPLLLLPVVIGLMYKNKRIAALLKKACINKDKALAENEQVSMPLMQDDAGASIDNANTDVDSKMAWLNHWDRIKHQFDCKIDLESYFKKQKIGEADLDVLNLGMVHFATGKVIACDPLVELGEINPYIQTIPAGIYPVKIAVSDSDYSGIRYACAKVEVSDKKPIRYELAMTGKEKLAQEFEEGDIFGFGVDAGMACIADALTQDAFNDFWKKLWDRDNTINPYDALFSDLLEENYKKYPKYQSNIGDWLNWRIPGTDCDLPIFASGWGDGYYPVYFGYDAAGEITGVYVHFIDIEKEWSRGDVEVHEEEDDFTEKTYTNWLIETDNNKQNGFTMNDVKRQLEAIKQGAVEFVIFTPLESIKVKEGYICSFVQLCQGEEAAYFHVEVSIANAIKSSDYVIYGIDHRHEEEVQKLLCELLERRIVPDYHDWDIVADMRIEEKNMVVEEEASSYKSIAELVTGDTEMLGKLTECFHSPRKYYHEHAEQYEERGFEGNESEEQIRWIGLADEMIACGAAVELDWKTDKEEFLEWIKELAKRPQLLVKDDWLKEDGDIPVWCATLDEKWAGTGFCVAAMDIDSDSYVIFICKKEALEQLKALSEKINHRFEFAKNM